jgi:hypothetical protein
MNRTFLWIALAAGVVGILAAIWWAVGKGTAPLNASGYTYPSTTGA